jgi:hypothetical protein
MTHPGGVADHPPPDRPLTHAHGISQCWKREGHRGKHVGYCDTCDSWGEYSRLGRDLMEEDRPIVHKMTDAVATLRPHSSDVSAGTPGTATS